MTQSLRSYYQNFVNQLQTIYEVSEAESIANIVFEEILYIKKQHIFFLDKQINDGEIEQLNFILGKLLKHEPVQYVLGIADFFGFRFKVDNNVLIPRRETEELVDLIIKDVRNTKPESGSQAVNEINILDIGTGSGCIAISLKKNLPFAQLTAIDISKEAIKVASENAFLNKVSIDLIEADILNSQLSIPIAIGTNSQFNIIVSNPPYITVEEKNKMLKNVLEFEPHNALFITNNDPLQFYKAIADFAKKYLKENGKLYFEINESFGFEVKEMLEIKDFTQVEIIKDMQGKDRIVKCILSKTN
ncbi:MAG: peptide chain release factor N(5)-glutamine methyltransferase [Bacteroidota bacterium]